MDLPVRIDASLGLCVATEIESEGRHISSILASMLHHLLPSVGMANQIGRERWLAAALASIPAGSRILDAGAGTQQYRKYCGHLKYVSQDFGEYDGQGDASGLQMGEFDYGDLDIVSDIAAIPEPDASFDAIMCVEVLEHVPNPAQVFGEFARLLKPRGRLILTAPFCSLTHFAPYHFSTGFNRYWYEKHLEENGFDIKQLEPNGNFFEYLAQEVYRVPSVSRRYASRRPSPIDFAGVYLVQRMLRRLSQADAGSSELLCFGYHAVAQKRASRVS